VFGSISVISESAGLEVFCVFETKNLPVLGLNAEPPSPPWPPGACAQGTLGWPAPRTPVPAGQAVPGNPSKKIWNFTQELFKNAGFVVAVGVANGTPGSPLVHRRILPAGAEDASLARKA